MKKQQIVILYLFLFAFVLPIIGVSAKNTAIPDSLLTVDYVYEYTYSDTEKAHRIIELIRKRKLEQEFKIDITEGDLVFNNRKYNDARKFYTRALNSDSVQNNAVLYMELIHRIITCYDGIHDVEKTAEYVKLLLDKAEETGNREMRSIALFNMGKMLYYQEKKEQAYRLIKEAIEEMKMSDYRNKYPNLRHYYNILLTMQQRDNLFEEALETLDGLESVVIATTKEQTTIGGLQEKEMKTLLSLRASILSFLDRFEEADEVYKQWKEITKDYTMDDTMIIPYLLRSKNFDEVIEFCTPRERFYYEQNDTLSYHMKSIKRLMGKAYEGKKDYENATVYYKSLAVVVDSLKAKEQRSAALELATVYETHQKEVKLQEQEVHIKVRNILLLSAGIAIFFLLIILWRNMKHSHIVRQKNRLMATTIEDLLVYKDELFDVKNELNLLKTVVEPEVSGNIADSDYNISGSEVPEDKLLFETLDNMVVRGKLYLNPDLSREDLMKLIHVNKNRFGQIIQQYAGSNTTSYINNKRLEYAAKMLKIHPEYTIAAIADLSGIPNIPTFNRLFKAKFGMTPAEFRDSL